MRAPGTNPDTVIRRPLSPLTFARDPAEADAATPSQRTWKRQDREPARPEHLGADARPVAHSRHDVRTSRRPVSAVTTHIADGRGPRSLKVEHASRGVGRLPRVTEAETVLLTPSGRADPVARAHIGEAGAEHSTRRTPRPIRSAEAHAVRAVIVIARPYQYGESCATSDFGAVIR